MAATRRNAAGRGHRRSGCPPHLVANPPSATSSRSRLDMLPRCPESSGRTTPRPAMRGRAPTRCPAGSSYPAGRESAPRYPGQPVSLTQQHTLIQPSPARQVVDADAHEGEQVGRRLAAVGSRWDTHWDTHCGACGDTRCHTRLQREHRVSQRTKRLPPARAHLHRPANAPSCCDACPSPDRWRAAGSGRSPAGRTAPIGNAPGRIRGACSANSPVPGRRAPSPRVCPTGCRRSPSTPGCRHRRRAFPSRTARSADTTRPWR